MSRHRARASVSSYRRSTPAGFRRAECSRSLRSSDTLHTLPSSSPTTESSAPRRDSPSRKAPAPPSAPPPHSGIMFRSYFTTHHASAPRLPAGRCRLQSQASSAVLVVAYASSSLFIHTSLRSFLAAWTPPAGSLDPRLFQRPRASHSFVFSKTKLCLLWEIETPSNRNHVSTCWQFNIHNSTFIIHHSSFIIQRSGWSVVGFWASIAQSPFVPFLSLAAKPFSM